MTLLASEENLGKEAKAPPIDDDLLTVSTWTDDVSCILCPLDRRGPKETFKETVANQLSLKVCGDTPSNVQIS